MASPSDLLKIPFLLSLTIAASIGIYTAPNPTPSSRDQSKYGKRQLLDRFASADGLPFAKFFMAVEALCETIVILSRRYPTSEFAQQVLPLLVRNPRVASSTALTPTFLAGWALVVAGALIRRTCYRYLGKQFTFTLSVQKDHKLITTGPYSVVRHPGYSGALIMVAGLLLAELGGGSWLREARVTESPFGMAFVALWVVHTVGMSIVALSRTVREDEVLRKEFGAKWDEWARRTPRRVFPGIY